MAETMLTQKYGPLPMWAWMGLGLGGALAYSSWQRNKLGAAPAASSPNATQTPQIPGSQTAPFVFLANIGPSTQPMKPPGAGRPIPAPTTGPPPPPVNLRVTGTSASSVSLAWDAAAGATSYDVEERSALGASKTSVSGVTFTKDRLAPNLSHVFSVIARNAYGASQPVSITASTKEDGGGGPPSGPPPQRRTVVVEAWPAKRSTLWGIAEEVYGTGSRMGDIYNANASLIESTAQRNGRPNSNGGHWIYPGMTLQLP